MKALKGDAYAKGRRVSAAIEVEVEVVLVAIVRAAALIRWWFGCGACVSLEEHSPSEWWAWSAAGPWS